MSCGKGGIKVSAVLLPPEAFAQQGGGRPVAKGLLKVKVSVVLLMPGEDFQWQRGEDVPILLEANGYAKTAQTLCFPSFP